MGINRSLINLGRFSDLQQSGVVLSDLNGRILYYYDMSYVGKQVPSDIYSRGYILRVDNDVIGILYPAALFSETFMQLASTILILLVSLIMITEFIT